MRLLKIDGLEEYFALLAADPVRDTALVRYKDREIEMPFSSVRIIASQSLADAEKAVEVAWFKDVGFAVSDSLAACIVPVSVGSLYNRKENEKDVRRR